MTEGVAELDEAAGDEASARAGGSWVVGVVGFASAVGDDETAFVEGTWASVVAAASGGDVDAA